MELEQLIEKIDALKIELDALRPIREDRLNRLTQKMRLDWNFHSNSIEGNTLSASETKAFLLHGITANGKPFRDYLEMRGHNEALKKLESIVHNELQITETLIKEFHKMILVEPYADSQAEINPGKYKTLPNYLYSVTGERIDFAAPEDVAEKMNSLVNWLNNHISPPKRKKRQYDKHPLLIATIFHLEFINIHPFGDGNGRMARILMNLVFMLTGYTPAIIKLEKREGYYANLNLSSAENAVPFATYLAETLIESLTLAIKMAKGERVENDDLEKQIELLHQEVNVNGRKSGSPKP